MVQIRQRVLTGAACLLLLPALAVGQRFYPDDPIEAMPAPIPVKDLHERKIDVLADFLFNSVRDDPRPGPIAGEINTIGEVPDSAWFTNRHARQRLSVDALRAGPGADRAPVPPFTVIGGKTEGITPGFRMKDSKGRLYFVKPDPMSNPEMATAADLIVSKFLWAIGYNTPENYVVYPHKSDLILAEDATINREDGSTRRMIWSDLEAIIAAIPHSADGSFRILASLAAEGEPVGPFRYEGTRSDDPNDIVPHENRRELRGLAVIAAWLNHTDAKSGNSLDTVVEANGVHFIRHYLIDFGSALGSDSDRAKDPRYGNEYVLPRASDALLKIFTLGLFSPKWERADFPHLDAVGHLESKVFEPEKWKPDYPNPAFLARRPDDEYWAAKQVMSFTDDDIRTIVEQGRFADPRVVDYLVKTLAERRDKIGRTYFAKVLPLDNFAVENNELRFEDLAAKYRFRQAQNYTFLWSRFDNRTQQVQELPGERSARLPPEADSAAAGAYFCAVIRPADQATRTVTVYVRKQASGYRVVGVERSW